MSDTLALISDTAFLNHTVIILNIQDFLEPYYRLWFLLPWDVKFHKTLSSKTAPPPHLPTFKA